MKSAVLLERKMAQAANGVTPGVPAAPEGYLSEVLFDAEGKCKVDVPEGYGITKDDPILNGVAKDALAAGIPNSAFEVIVESFLRLSGLDGVESAKAYQEAQVAELGPQGEVLKEQNAVFLQALRQSGDITESEFQLAFTGLNSSADGIRFTAKLAALAAGTKLESIPGSADDDVIVSVAPYTEEELRERVADSRYDTDRAFREETSRGFAVLYGTGEAPEGSPPKPLPQFRP